MSVATVIVPSDGERAGLIGLPPRRVMRRSPSTVRAGSPSEPAPSSSLSVHRQPEHLSVYGSELEMSRVENTVNSGKNTVNLGSPASARAPVTFRKPADIIDLQKRIAAAAARLPPKELERETGLPAREAEELKTATRLPHLPNLRKLTRHDPNCLEAVVRFLVGETGTGAPGEHSAQTINELIRRLTR
jgi:hypothetical protein